MEFIWIYVYYLICQIAKKLTTAGTNSQWIQSLAIALYTIALLVWLFLSGKARKLGLCRIKRNYARFAEIAFFLLVFPMCNLFTSAYLEKDPAVIVMTFSICLIEEIFFRGLLLQYLKRYGIKACVLLSSGLFALYHLGNLFVLRDVGYVLLQTVAAFSAGICYAVYVLLLDSLLPCAAAHLFVNITAAPDMNIQTGALLMCTGVSCFCYYYFMGKKVLADKGETLK